MPRRPSVQTLSVLELFVASPEEWRYGYDLSKQLEMPSGTLYPILMRMADRGHLETRWESSPIEGRPPRHLYRLTGDGQRWATTALRQRAAGRLARELPAEGTA